MNWFKRNQQCSARQKADLHALSSPILSLRLTGQITVRLSIRRKQSRGWEGWQAFVFSQHYHACLVFLWKQWNPSAVSHKNYKKANSRWRWTWNGPLNRAATRRIMQPFRLFIAGAPFVPRTDMLLHWGFWKDPLCSICLKAADLCDNLRSLDVKVSFTHW